MAVWKRIGDLNEYGIPVRGWMLAISPDFVCAVRPLNPDASVHGPWHWELSRKDEIVAGGLAPEWPLAMGAAGERLSDMMNGSAITFLSGHTVNRVCYVVDFEASALGPGSYPIEVAICDTTEGPSNAPYRTARSWLIRPTDTWLATGVWSPESERIHGIKLDNLLKEGRPVEEVCREMVDALPGIHNLYTDAVGLDGMWLNRLFAAIDKDPPFNVEALPPLLDELTVSGGLSGAAEIEQARDAAFRRYPHIHRALPDAQRNAEIVRELLGVAED